MSVPAAIATGTPCTIPANATDPIFAVYLLPVAVMTRPAVEVAHDDSLSPIAFNGTRTAWREVSPASPARCCVMVSCMIFQWPEGHVLYAGLATFTIANHI